MRPLVGMPALAALALVAGACASTGQNADPAELAGCYYFDQDDVARDLRLPWGFRLQGRSLSAEAWPAVGQLEGARVASTLNARAEADHPFGHWQPLAGDSILVGYPGGGGLSLRLAPVTDGLGGTAHPVGDATLARDRPAYAVHLIRARCPEDV